MERNPRQDERSGRSEARARVAALAAPPPANRRLRGRRPVPTAHGAPPDPTASDLARAGALFSLVYLGAWALARGPFTLVDLGPFLALLGWSMWLWTRRRAPLGFVAAVVPLLLWPLLYDGAVQIVMLAPERYVDGWLTQIDAAVMLRPLGPPPWPLGGPREELANFLYASFYAGIPLGFLFVWRRHGTTAAGRYVAAFLATFAVCGVIWLLFPSGGYHASGSPTTPAWGPFTALMRDVYRADPHYAAAFPSSHVALATTAASMVAWYGRRPVWVLWWPLGIAWATIYGQYHYAVDSPPALLIGVAAAAWAVRTEWGPTRAPAPDTSARERRAHRSLPPLP
ncbi:MAG: phosphatase PAP2 family protein [Myxococcota bacterium]